MGKRTNHRKLGTYAVIIVILSSTIAPATTINIDGDSAGNDLVSPGQIWRFFKGTEPPSNPPEAWKDINFDDSNWQTGPGGFGFGDNDDATVLDDMRGNYLSVYIRKEFSASSQSPDDVIALEIDYDDGFIAYLNGNEIARAHMDGDNVSYDSTATSAHEAGSPETFILGTTDELLNEGINVLAVEGHNVSLSSSDFSLIPTLRTASNITRIGETWIIETDTVTLTGKAEAPDVVSVLANGAQADFNADEGTWSIDISLNPGLNSITIEQLDANSQVINTRTVEIMYVAETNNATGELTENTTWSGICVVEGTVVVPAGVVLKIEPGTIVRMKGAARLIVYGQLSAEGTESNPIQFTRYSAGMPWKQIMFIEAEDSRLSHCIFEYADSEGEHQDYYVPGPRNYHEAIVALACHLDIENCIFRNLPNESGGAEGDAIAIIADDQDHPGKASANIRGCEFLSIGQGVHTRYSYVLVEDCYFTGKRGDNDDVDLWGESIPAPLIRNNLFLNPEHDDMINPTRCSAIIVGNIIAGSDDHGVVLRDECSPVMMNNLIFDCSSAGVAVENSCQATLINNTIIDCGRGVRLLDLGRWGPPYSLNPGGGTATIINCIIWDCPQPITLADSSNTQIEDRGSHITVKYSDIEGGQNGISVSGSQSTFTWRQGNINEDPQFAAANNGDYHLKSQAGRWDASSESWVLDNVTSPCIDTGDPNSPVAFEPSPNGAVINLGTYGGTPEASKSPSGLNAKYGGGTGVSNDPYLIYTAQHLNNISTEPNDWGKHFKLMADIDLTGYSYNQALIAPDIDTDEYYFQGNRYVGIFDGNHHTISNLTITGVSYLGLFGELGFGSTVKNLGVVDVNISGSGDAAGGLLGHSREGANIIRCYSTGTVDGDDDIGGLVGINGGNMTQCYSISTVSGNYIIGGLLGANERQAIVANCYSTGAVNGDDVVGGLMGFNLGEATHCYSAGVVTADQRVGGLVGWIYGNIVSSFWDIDTSNQADMCGSQEEGASGCDDSFGLTTLSMQTASTFLDAGWDFVEETENGIEDLWWINEGQDYPRLWWKLSD
jgi:hypothetical protein